MEHDHISNALNAIDRVLEQPPVSIEQALCEAVHKGRMTQDEARECLEAYQRTFVADDPEGLGSS